MNWIPVHSHIYLSSFESAVFPVQTEMSRPLAVFVAVSP